MITPKMTNVDFASVKNVGKRRRGLIITLIVNWLVTPFDGAAALAVFLSGFSGLPSSADADQNIAGTINPDHPALAIVGHDFLSYNRLVGVPLLLR